MESNQNVHSEPSERSVIGSCLTWEEAVEVAVDMLQPSDFFFVRHQVIFSAIQAMASLNRGIDQVSLTEWLRSRGQLEAAGGPDYAGNTINTTPTASGIEDYARIVKECAVRRKLFQVGTEIQQLDGTRPIEEMCARTEHIVFETTQRIHKHAAPKADLGTVVDNLLSENQEQPISLGIAGLDRLLDGGIRKGTLVYLQARPSMGKTTLAANFIFHVTTQLGVPVKFFSLEENRNTITGKFLSIASGVDSRKFNSREFTAEEMTHLVQCRGVINNMPLEIVDQTVDTDVIMSMCRRSARAAERDGRPLGLIVLDHLSRITIPPRHANGLITETQRASFRSRALKDLVQELQIPVICCCQVNRKQTQRDDPEPEMTDGQDSGNIEQDADIILAPFRPNYYDKARNGDLFSPGFIHVVKNRLGIAGVKAPFVMAKWCHTVLDAPYLLKE